MNLQELQYYNTIGLAGKSLMIENITGFFFYLFLVAKSPSDNIHKILPFCILLSYIPLSYLLFSLIIPQFNGRVCMARMTHTLHFTC